MWGVLEAGPAGFSELVPEPRLLPPGHLRSGLACCHTVALLRGQLLGDPLELKMVESTGWVCYRVTYFKVLELACISFKNLDFFKKIIDENVCSEALSVSQSENINGNWSKFFSDFADSSRARWRWQCAKCRVWRPQSFGSNETTRSTSLWSSEYPCYH